MIGAALFIIFLIIMLILRAGKKKQENTEFHNSTMAQASASQADNGLGEEPQETAPTGKTVPEYQGGDGAVDGDSPYKGQAEGHSLVTKNGVTYVDGIMIVNKTFSLPKDYNPGLDPAAQTAFNNMAAAAWGEGISLWICSGFRTYDEQDQLFDSYASARGLDEADEVSARPGHSEHQSGLCMDVNSTEFEFANTAESQWLETHCAEYGFIIRFPQGKESFTGYAYEPWHIRYVGVETAMAMKTSGQCLEEYLGVTSDYKDSLENEDFVKKYSGSGTADTEPAQTEAPADEWTYNDGGQQDYGYDNGYGQDQGYDYGYGYDDGYNYDYNYDWGY
ncbi:MAG: M15 family metallopeptidase [Ruminococcus sp.]|nr:M15 family metallopeptidase [Ruminococcus sp.]